MADVVQIALGKLVKESEEHAHECDAKLEQLHAAVKASEREQALAADKRVAVEAQVHSKARTLEGVKTELEALNKAIAAKEAEMETAFEAHDGHVEALKAQRAGHEESIRKAREILEAVQTTGLTAQVGAASLLEVVSTHASARTLALAKRVSTAVAEGPDHAETEAKVQALLSKLVASVEGSLVASKAHHDRVISTWEQTKKSMHAQVEALATRKSAKLSHAALLHQQLALQQAGLEEAKTHEAATKKHLDASRSVEATATAECKHTATAMAAQVDSKREDLQTAHTLEDMLADHHATLLSETGATGATGAALPEGAGGFVSMVSTL